MNLHEGSWCPEKASTMAFSKLKAPTRAFREVGLKLWRWCNYHNTTLGAVFLLWAQWKLHKGSFRALLCVVWMIEFYNSPWTEDETFLMIVWELKIAWTEQTVKLCLSCIFGAHMEGKRIIEKLNRIYSRVDMFCSHCILKCFRVILN